MEPQSTFRQSMIGNALAFAFNAIISNVLSWIAFVFVSIFFMFLGAIGVGIGYFIVERIVPASERPILIVADKFAIWQVQGFGNNALAIGIALIALAYFFALWLGFHRAYIRFYDTGEIKYRPVFNMHMILSAICAWTLLLPLVIGGMILLLVPGIMVILRSFFTQYFIVDKNMGPIEAIQASWALTKGKYNQMAGLLLVTILCGLIPIIGMYVVSLIAVYAYRNLAQAS